MEVNQFENKQIDDLYIIKNQSLWLLYVYYPFLVAVQKVKIVNFKISYLHSYLLQLQQFYFILFLVCYRAEVLQQLLQKSSQIIIRCKSCYVFQYISGYTPTIEIEFQSVRFNLQHQNLRLGISVCILWTNCSFILRHIFWLAKYFTRDSITTCDFYIHTYNSVNGVDMQLEVNYTTKKIYYRRTVNNSTISYRGALVITLVHEQITSLQCPIETSISIFSIFQFELIKISTVNTIISYKSVQDQIWSRMVKLVGRRKGQLENYFAFLKVLSM
ncbi:Hypothetical_protein [Hexamita inflata]|uniref:Hypothetical_protein n=1 Tax=Hexamita inflata TaxID=28002 RepID=A0ABP1I0F7_9EUKA